LKVNNFFRYNMKKITIAYSPCPNDTFIFHALSAGLIDTGNFITKTVLADVESLNRAALRGRYTVTKLSAVAWLSVKERYTLLDSGAALGSGCGPLLVRRPGSKPVEKCSIAVPGRHTTAFALLRMWMPGLGNFIETGFDSIIEDVARGTADAGLIIHEGRFIYQRYGLEPVVDLGDWWERTTGQPIPLGVIAADNNIIPPDEALTLSDMIKNSLLYARSDPGASAGYVKANAQEMDEAVVREHISLYVNDYSVSMGERGREALRVLEGMSRAGNLI
jgi:1,4-dihydroxy-6-naphthoate synthase